MDPALANSGGRNRWTWRRHGRQALLGPPSSLMTKRISVTVGSAPLRVFYCGRTLILLRATSKLRGSTGLWVDTQSWQRLSQLVSELTHTLGCNWILVDLGWSSLPYPEFLVKTDEPEFPPPAFCTKFSLTARKMRQKRK